MTPIYHVMKEIRLRFQLDSLCFRATKLLGLHVGEAVEHLNISAVFCDYDDAQWEIRVQTPDGITHGFGGFDHDNAILNLRRFGLKTIRRCVEQWQQQASTEQAAS